MSYSPNSSSSSCSSMVFTALLGRTNTDPESRSKGMLLLEEMITCPVCQERYTDKGKNLEISCRHLSALFTGVLLCFFRSPIGSMSTQATSSQRYFQLAFIPIASNAYPTYCKETESSSVLCVEHQTNQSKSSH